MRRDSIALFWRSFGFSGVSADKESQIKQSWLGFFDVKLG
jgi:hypothetical protein